MTASEIQFPHKKLRAARVTFHPHLVSRSGGVSISGAEQIVATSAGRWGATLQFEVGQRFGRDGFSSPRDADTILVWRALLAKLEGRTNILKIGPYDGLNAPAGVAGTSYGGLTAHSDTAPFSDASHYAQAQTPAAVAAAYAVGATTVYVNMLAGHEPEPGQYFSVFDRMFLIKAAAETTTADKWELTVWPPAREAVTAAQVAVALPAEFDEPQCKMRFAQDGTGQLQLEQLYRASPSLELVEAVV